MTHNNLMLMALAVLVAPIGNAENQDVSGTFFEDPWLLGAHRGGADETPENTAYGFAEMAKRFPGILLECDIRLTKDGHVVLLHDATVDRTTDGSGAISALTLAEAQALDAAYRFTTDGGETFPVRGKGIRIPTLSEAIQAAPLSRFEIELKDGEGIAEKAVAILEAEGAMDRVLFASFKPALIQRFRELAPAVPTCYDMPQALGLIGALRGDAWADYEPPSAVLSVSKGMLKQFDVSPEDIARIRAKGIRYQIHTIDDRATMEALVAQGVDSILTDKPSVLAEVIAGAE